MSAGLWAKNGRAVYYRPATVKGKTFVYCYRALTFSLQQAGIDRLRHGLVAFIPRVQVIAGVIGGQETGWAP